MYTVFFSILNIYTVYIFTNQITISNQKLKRVFKIQNIISKEQSTRAQEQHYEHRQQHNAVQQAVYQAHNQHRNKY